MLIKKDKNKELEKILEQKEVNEQAKNLLQGILYKIEVSYKDYKIVKGKKQTEEKYVKEMIDNIKKKCDKITVINLKQRVQDEEIQKELDENKFFVEEEIVSYPIEEKILYAIEKKSRYSKILNNKYEEKTTAISDFINTGKNMDRVEVIRDFNGWSWTTVKKEIGNIEANLIYQMLQIILGEEFLNNWCEDKDGIIDYLELFQEEITSKYSETMAENLKELLIELAITNTYKENKKFAQELLEKINRIEEELQKYEDTKQKIEQITENKKLLLKELNKVEQILGQRAKLKSEYEKINEDTSIEQKIFNINVLKKQLNNKKKELLEKIGKANYILTPSNYLEEKNKLMQKKQELKSAEKTEKQVEKILVEFIENFLKCFEKLVENTENEDEIVRLMYQFRYFMLLPFNLENCVKDIKKLEKQLSKVEKILVQKAIQKDVIADVPFEVMKHVFETKIIILEDLFYKITKKDEKQFVQIFDENISEEKFEITPLEKTKLNKKIKIFT